MSQLPSTATTVGAERCFRCPYQAKVMKVLEMMSRRTVSISGFSPSRSIAPRAATRIFAKTSPRHRMVAQRVRYCSSDHQDVVHELPAIRFDGQLIAVRLLIRRTDDGVFRGRVMYGAPDTEAERSTAEIFCATSEQDLWQSVRDLRDHHLRDLYRSLL